MVAKHFNIFQHEGGRTARIEKPGDLEKQRPPRVGKARHSANDAERLTGESRQQNVVRRNALGGNLSDVTLRLKSKVSQIHFAALGVNVASHHALRLNSERLSCSANAKVETADPTEEVYKPQAHHS